MYTIDISFIYRMKKVSAEGHVDKIRDGNFKFPQSTHDSGPLYHKLRDEHQMVVEGQGPFVECLQLRVKPPVV